MPFANLNGQIMKAPFRNRDNPLANPDTWLIELDAKDERGEINPACVYFPKHLVGKRVKLYWMLEEEQKKFDK